MRYFGPFMERLLIQQAENPRFGELVPRVCVCVYAAVPGGGGGGRARVGTMLSGMINSGSFHLQWVLYGFAANRAC